MDRLLAQLSQSVETARTLEDLVRPLLEMLEAVTGLDSTYLTSIDLAAQRQSVVFSRNSGSLQIPEGIDVPWDDTLCRRALEEGRVQCDDVPARWGDSDAARALGLQTYVSVPVRMGDGALFGTLCAASAGRHVIDADAENVLRLFSRLIGYHIERERLIEQLRRANEELSESALSDPLTGLPNRRSLAQELNRMLARGQRDDRALVVAFIDLDAFKPINDRHGHAAGDHLLRTIAARLLQCVRKTDTVARLGGDEFVVVVDGFLSFAQLHALARKIVDVVGEPVEWRDASLSCSVSIGVAAYPPAASWEALIDAADRAMYQAKAKGSGAIVIAPLGDESSNSAAA